MLSDIYIKVHDTTDMIYTDKMGRFPVVSSREHKYIMFLCEVDDNYTALKPMKSKSKSEIIMAYNAVINCLKKSGIKPKK